MNTPEDPRGLKYRCVVSDQRGSGTLIEQGGGRFLVYAPATGPALEHDLTQRGAFWRREDAELFARHVNDLEGRCYDAPLERLSLFDQRQRAKGGADA